MLLRRAASTGFSLSRRSPLGHARRWCSQSSHSKFPPRSGLYDPALEMDSCGVGLVAHMKGQPARSIIVDANTMLVRMTHRGGCGCEANAGDGAGMLLALPDGFMRQVAKQDAGIDLPEKGMYGVGNLFLSQDAEATEKSKAYVHQAAEQYGMKVLGWRSVPVDNKDIGTAAKTTEPNHQQVFMVPNAPMDNAALERQLYLVRKAATNFNLADADPAVQDFYACSLSSRTITYKGQLTPEQLYTYFVDLQQENFQSHCAFVHSRFSTNTFPSWSRAQPLRMLCHNGEINTLRGNSNMMSSREGIAWSPTYQDETTNLFPVCSNDMSDSGKLDAVVELLHQGSGRHLAECMMMVVPEAWQGNPLMPEARRDMYQYNSCLMEPWDGPAMLAATDGRVVVACLDRNGLRPSRFYVTSDDRIILSSEVGVIKDLPEELVVKRGRLEPGKMFLVDFEEGRIVPDGELKAKLAGERPYGEWVRQNMTSITEWEAAANLPPLPPYTYEGLTRKLNMFGYTRESLGIMISGMVQTGKEPLGSMGVDTPPAILSTLPQRPYAYFKQLFAQVTNPPIDPIREECVMALECPVGPEQNLLAAPSAEHCHRLTVEHPVLTCSQLEAVQTYQHGKWWSTTIDATFDKSSGLEGFRKALDDICEQAVRAVNQDKCPVLVLSDRAAGLDRYAVPSLLATGAVHQALLRDQTRTQTALFCESGDAREVNDLCLLVGFGADGVCPYVAYEAACQLNSESPQPMPEEKVVDLFRKAISKGSLKVMSKMGISTLQSYKGAQIYEAIGFSEEVMDLCFTGNTSRIKGIGFAQLYDDIVRLHEHAYPRDSSAEPLLFNPGEYHYRDANSSSGSEVHYNSPKAVSLVQAAARTGSVEAYKQYAAENDNLNRRCHIRGLFEFKVDPFSSIPIEEVEPAGEIVKRFATGAMSLGSISTEAHEALAVAMNALGGKSNTGEGGENPARFLDNRRSAIKQVASGRFGVTSNYLTNADQIQIKMAQGAKPGEGGELPGFKVSELIANTRGTTEGVGLISPPPHHDIYSIEDMAQLIHDCKNANREASVSVKLVSEIGVGVVAAGVAKARADHIVIGGGDGGTGAAAWTGIKSAGMPWEIGLAEVQQTLVLNDLRGRIVLQVDGQLKSGRDVVVGALLGAEEFGFATTPLITLGCIMMRKCHLNTCPVGVATQDPVLRKKFEGKPEHVINFFFLMAEEIRENMAAMGFRKFEDMVGRTDMLRVNPDALNSKTKHLDLGPILTPAASLHPEADIRNTGGQDHELDIALDHQLIRDAMPALETGQPVQVFAEIGNTNRTAGTMLSNELTKRYGAVGLPEDTVHIKMTGHAGQSFGFTVAPGVTLEVEGDANDGCGKGLSGGKIVVYPPKFLDGTDYLPEDNLIVGNVACYGATGGQVNFRGIAGERFCVRNSGAIAVVEGVGDHGCEYMTGGQVVILGSTGRNFAAGMSGGVAYIWDPKGEFPPKCNMEMVGLEKVEDPEDLDALHTHLEKHAARTGSTVASGLLDRWTGGAVDEFVKVMPHDYKRVLLERAARRSAEEDVAVGA